MAPSVSVLVISKIVITNGEEADEVLPAASVAVVVNEYFPELRVEDVIEKEPLLSAAAEPKRVEPL